MAYEQTNWKAGDTVTSAKLNKIEQGIAGGANILIIHGIGATVEGQSIMRLDKTVKEILDADFTNIILQYSAETTFKKAFLIIDTINFSQERGYSISAVDPLGKTTYVFRAATEDDYPEEEPSSK